LTLLGKTIRTLSGGPFSPLEGPFYQCAPAQSAASPAITVTHRCPQIAQLAESSERDSELERLRKELKELREDYDSVVGEHAPCANLIASLRDQIANLEKKLAEMQVDSHASCKHVFSLAFASVYALRLQCFLASRPHARALRRKTRSQSYSSIPSSSAPCVPLHLP